MCCIIYRTKDTIQIKESNLKAIIKKNPHGWGASYMKDNLLVVKKSMNMDEAIPFIRGLEKDNVDFLFHARWATHGEKNLQNCHPYAITNGVLFHNGTIKMLHCWNKDMSDTWHFGKQVNKFTKRKKSLTDIINRFSAKINTSRLAFMLNDGSVTFHGTWHEIEGCKYSKTDWKYDDYNYYAKYGQYVGNNGMINFDSDYDNAYDDCQKGRIFNYQVKKLNRKEILKLIMRFPDVMANYFYSNNYTNSY